MKRILFPVLLLMSALCLSYLYSCQEDEAEIITASFSFENASISISEETEMVSFSIELSNELTESVSISYSSVNQTATSGEDFEVISGELTFEAGETEKSFTFALINDEEFEDDETFLLVASADSRFLTHTDSVTAMITILNDDEPTSGYTVNETMLTIPEDTATLTFTVSLTKELAEDVTVFYETIDQTAVSNEDYEPISGEIVFNTGELQKSITLNILNDDLVEEVESFLLIVKDTSSNLTTDSLATTINIVSEDVTPATVNVGFTYQVNVADSYTYSFTNTTMILGIDDLTGMYIWDFGENETSNQKSPTHTFSGPGEYKIILTATAADGVTATATEIITIVPKNKYAVIADTNDTDTGELSYSSADSIRTGRVTFDYRTTKGASNGFIKVAGTSRSGDDAIVEVRIKEGDDHAFREGASDAAIASANFPTPKVDVWVPVEVSWFANGTDTPTYGVKMDGQTVITNATSTTNGGDRDVPGHLEATRNGAQIWVWQYGWNNNTDDFTFHIDNIVIYSSDSGFETTVFSDDFQSYQTGTSLDPNRNFQSMYTEYSFDVTVSEED